MDDFLIIALLAVLLLLGLVAVLVLRRKKGGVSIPNYRTLFIIGVVWLPLGVVTGNTVFWVVALIMVGVGLINRSKWNEERKWSDLTAGEKKLKIFLMAGLFALLVGLVVFYMLRP